MKKACFCDFSGPCVCVRFDFACLLNLILAVVTLHTVCVFCMLLYRVEMSHLGTEVWEGPPPAFLGRMGENA